MNRKILGEISRGEAFYVKEIFTLLLLEQKTLKAHLWYHSQQLTMCFISVSFCLSDTK